MRALAAERDLEAVDRSRHRTGPEAERADGEQWRDMQAEHGVHVSEQARLQNLLRAARRLLGGLEDQLDAPRQRCFLLLQQQGCTEQRRRMEIMAAGVHAAGNLRRIWQPRLLRNGQRIDVGSQGHDRPLRIRGTSRPDLRHKPRLQAAVEDGDVMLLQDLAHALRRLHFFVGQFRMPMQPAERLLYDFLFFLLRHEKRLHVCC